MPSACVLIRVTQYIYPMIMIIAITTTMTAIIMTTIDVMTMTSV